MVCLKATQQKPLCSATGKKKVAFPGTLMKLLLFHSGHEKDPDGITAKKVLPTWHPLICSRVK